MLFSSPAKSAHYEEMMEYFRVQNRISSEDFIILHCGVAVTRITWLDSNGSNSLTHYCFQNAYIDEQGLVKGWRQVDGCTERAHKNTN